jgi:hypothetical protein
MEPSSPRIGLAVTAAGGALTAFAVYQPWYGVGFTQAGVGAAEQQIAALPVLAPYAQQFGDAATTLVGHSVVGLSAHEALHQINVVLLLIAGVAILAALVGLASAAPQLSGELGQLVTALGIVGVILVAFRMIIPPNPMPDFITISLRPGAFLALAGCAAIAGGSLWARREAPTTAPAPGAEPADPNQLWSDLSGWTPS